MSSSSYLFSWAFFVLLAMAPLDGTAQLVKKVPRVGLIANVLPLNGMESTPVGLAFQSELTKLGWTPGRNIEILWRSLENDPTRLANTLDDLLRHDVDVIIVGGNFAAKEAQKKTRTVGIVTLAAFDPVGTGLVSDLRRPGGNITGIIEQPDAAIDGKRLSLFREILPGLTRMARFSWDHPSANTPRVRERDAAFERTAQGLGIKVMHYRVRRVEELEAALADAKKKRADGVFLDWSSLLTNPRAQALITSHAETHRLPVMHGALSGAEAGGLIAYGTRPNAHVETAARFVDRILKGARPGDIPFEQVGNYALYVNMRTAKAIGLTIPASILTQADKVIE